MSYRIFLTILFTCNLFVSFAQRISGKIIDSANNQPIPGASIFINNSFLGSSTNDDGNFSFSGANISKVDLVISAVSYNTRIIQLSSKDTGFLTIVLSRKIQELETVVLQSFEEDGWNKYGQFFLDNFIGSNENAADCRIKNKKVIKFRFNKKTKVLSVVAFEPLLIENKYLGYDLQYNLEGWEYDYNTERLMYTGYPFFKEMPGTAKQKKRWQQNMMAAYQGSLMHFLRAVYRNQIAREGFVVNFSTPEKNLEKERVKAVLKALRNNSLGTINLPDSMDYYMSIMQQRNVVNRVRPDTLKTDSFAFAINNTTAALQFPHSLRVLYKMSAADQHKTKYGASSFIHILDRNYIPIYADGSYDFTESLLQEGTWAYRGKILFLLPVGYEPD